MISETTTGLLGRVVQELPALTVLQWCWPATAEANRRTAASPDKVDTDKVALARTSVLSALVAAGDKAGL